MNVLFISPAIKNYRRTSELPMALISMATYLSQCGHTVKIIDRLVKVTDIEMIIKGFKPDFVGITLMYANSIDDASKCSQVSQKYGAKVVWGGHLATDVPELILNESFVDFVIMGEGEFACGELLQAFEKGGDYSGIKGIAYKNNGRIIINECREFCNLADIPPMDFSFVNPKDYFQSYNFCKKQVHLYSSKGCPGNCAFCYNPHYHQSTHRKRPVEHVTTEIRSLIVKYGADGIYFEDENWRTNSKDIAEACKAFASLELDFVWGCKSRIGILTPEDFRIMYESGCRWIFFGVETASVEMRHSIHKGIRMENVKSDISHCAKAGILPVSSFIAGLPNETCEQLKETVEMAKSLKDSILLCNLFRPLIGSEYYKRFLTEGKIMPATSLEDLKKHRIVDDYLECNYSKVPLRDLNVVRAYFHWWSLYTKPKTKDDSGYSLIRKVLNESFGTVSRLGLTGIIAETRNAFRSALSFGVNLLCFPKVKKKYGLKLNRNRI